MAQSQAIAPAISTLPTGKSQSQGGGTMAAHRGGLRLPRAMAAHRGGLELPQRLPFEKWLSIGMQLSAINTSSAWCLGDWLVYGIEAFSGRYRSAVEQTALDYQTLRNYVWVAKSFPLSRRRLELSFGHHAEVAALSEPEQDFWLRKAEELGWSVKQLRQEVRASLRERKVVETDRNETDRSRQHFEGSQEDERHWAEENGVEPEMLKLNIRINRRQFETWKAAAAKAGLDMEEWAAIALTNAACDTLER